MSALLWRNVEFKDVDLSVRLGRWEGRLWWNTTRSAHLPHSTQVLLCIVQGKGTLSRRSLYSAGPHPQVPAHSSRLSRSGDVRWPDLLPPVGRQMHTVTSFDQLPLHGMALFALWFIEKMPVLRIKALNVCNRRSLTAKIIWNEATDALMVENCYFSNRLRSFSECSVFLKSQASKPLQLTVQAFRCHHYA